MRMHWEFKTPEELLESDEFDEFVDEEGAEGDQIDFDGPPVDDGSWSDVEVEQVENDVSDFSDSDFNAQDSDESMESDCEEVTGDDETEVEKTKTNNTTTPNNRDIKDEVPASSSSSRTTATAGATRSSGSGCAGGDSDDASEKFEFNEEDEDDETVRAIIAAIKKPRTSPPEIKLEDFITDICFHPERDIIALGTITGDVVLYEYKNDGNTLLRTIEIHAKACRDVEFSEDGVNLLTCSKDKSIMITDMETEKLKKFYETAHDEAINKLHVIDENLFATGDDSGMVKLWDLRTKNSIFALKEVEDFISQMLVSENKKLLLVTSGDGYLTTLNIGARKLYVQSEPYDEELSCMSTYRGNSKLIVGTSKGRLYTYNWGQFGYHCDMYPGINTSISVMIPITDRIGCVAGEEGIIRACHIAPFRNLGIVGQHNMPIECLDINTTGELIASSSHNNDVRFWNIKYFEEFGDIKYNEKHNNHKEKRHNLPSSKYVNPSDFFSDMAKSASDDE